MTGFEGISDLLTEDGTTAFAMALGTRDIGMIRLLLAAVQSCDIDPKKMTKRAVSELDRDGSDNRYPDLRIELHEELRKYNVTLEKTPAQAFIFNKGRVGYLGH